MANALTTQLLQDGPRNAVVKVTGVLDTSNLALTTIIDPATLFKAPPLLRLMFIDYSITDQLECQLQWLGATNAPLLPLAGRGRMGFEDFGGLTNNAFTPEGGIQLMTTGWTSGVQVFSLVLELVKVGITGPVQ